MTKKKESTSEKKSRVKVGKLKLDKETVEELTSDKAAQVLGGVTGQCSVAFCTIDCPPLSGAGTFCTAEPTEQHTCLREYPTQFHC